MSKALAPPRDVSIPFRAHTSFSKHPHQQPTPFSIPSPSCSTGTMKMRADSSSNCRPNFVITLTRPHPSQSPSFANFIVPLNLHKLDLRDYLWNAYGVRVLGVRSYIQQQKVTNAHPGARGTTSNTWYRPRSIKKMMVELERPFVWPEEPEDYSRYVTFLGICVGLLVSWFCVLDMVGLVVEGGLVIECGGGCQ